MKTNPGEVRSPPFFKEGTFENDAKHVFERGWLYAVTGYIGCRPVATWLPPPLRQVLRILPQHPLLEKRRGTP